MLPDSSAEEVRGLQPAAEHELTGCAVRPVADSHTVAAKQKAQTPAALGPAPPRPIAAGTPLTAAGVQWLQRHAGNRATAALMASRAVSPPRRALLRDGQSCASCAAGKDKAAAPVPASTKPSHRKGKACEPARTIPGTLFVPWRDDEVARANDAVQGSKDALAKQNILLDIEVLPFLELGDLDFTERKKGEEEGTRSVGSYATVCRMMRELAFRRRRGGVVILMVPFHGEICGNHGKACYVPDFGADKCLVFSLLAASRVPDRLIILGKFGTEPRTLAHELGHHAGQPQRGDPTIYGHEEYDKGNYMNYPEPRDHYRDELLERMCSVSFQF